MVRIVTKYRPSVGPGHGKLEEGNHGANSDLADDLACRSLRHEQCSRSTIAELLAGLSHATKGVLEKLSCCHVQHGVWDLRQGVSEEVTYWTSAKCAVVWFWSAH
jgi:hypothetical protein